MREIKFCGKTFYSEWVHGLLYTYNAKYWILPIKPNKTGMTGYEYLGSTLEIEGAERVIPETVGEYTGLKDKNGKEIYEGDIVGYTNKDFLHNQPKYLVYYALGDGNYPAYDVKPRIKEISCNGLQFLVENYQIKVYGNKYENPELLAADAHDKN